MVTLARLRPRLPLTGDKKPAKDVFVVNTHYDDQGEAARRHSSQLILRRLKPVLAEAGPSALVILTGDLNSRPEDDGYRILTAHRYDRDHRASLSSGHAFIDTRHELARAPLLKDDDGRSNREGQLLSKPYGQTNTWTGFDVGEERMVIDFILAADNGAVESSGDRARRGYWRVKRHGVLPTKYEGKPRASDHRPVVVLFEKTE
jgi:endonuclease/exonuclease/phosphatase family metal-dependent hydrolase